MELIIRIFGGILLILGSLIFYRSVTDEGKLRKGNKRENDYGANIKLITGSLMLIVIGIVLIFSGQM